MLPRHHPDGIRIAFDDHRLVANAGLILPATLARRLRLPQLVHNHLNLGRAHGPGEHGRQDDDAGCVCAGWWRLHRRRRRVAHRRDRPRPGRSSSPRSSRVQKGFPGVKREPSVRNAQSTQAHAAAYALSTPSQVTLAGIIHLDLAWR